MKWWRRKQEPDTPLMKALRLLTRFETSQSLGSELSAVVHTAIKTLMIEQDHYERSRRDHPSNPGGPRLFLV